MRACIRLMSVCVYVRATGRERSGDSHDKDLTIREYSTYVLEELCCFTERRIGSAAKESNKT